MKIHFNLHQTKHTTQDTENKLMYKTASLMGGGTKIPFKQTKQNQAAKLHAKAYEHS